jgi:heat shock protein HslJ
MHNLRLAPLPRTAIVALGLAAALAFAACSAAGPSPSPSGPPGSSPPSGAPGSAPPSAGQPNEGAFANLVGTGWRVVRVDDTAPVAGSEPTIAFKEGRIEGTTGCNSYGGDVTINGATIEAGDMAMTLIGCMDEISEMETAFLAALDGAEELSSQGANLVIRGSGGEIVLRPDATVR